MHRRAGRVSEEMLELEDNVLLFTVQLPASQFSVNLPLACTVQSVLQLQNRLVEGSPPPSPHRLPTRRIAAPPTTTMIDVVQQNYWNASSGVSKQASDRTSRARCAGSDA